MKTLIYKLVSFNQPILPSPEKPQKAPPNYIRVTKLDKWGRDPWGTLEVTNFDYSQIEFDFKTAVCIKVSPDGTLSLVPLSSVAVLSKDIATNSLKNKIGQRWTGNGKVVIQVMPKEGFNLRDIGVFSGRFGNQVIRLADKIREEIDKAIESNETAYLLWTTPMAEGYRPQSNPYFDIFLSCPFVLKGMSLRPYSEVVALGRSEKYISQLAEVFNAAPETQKFIQDVQAYIDQRTSQAVGIYFRGGDLGYTNEGRLYSVVHPKTLLQNVIVQIEHGKIDASRPITIILFGDPKEKYLLSAFENYAKNYFEEVYADKSKSGKAPEIKIVTQTKFFEDFGSKFTNEHFDALARAQCHYLISPSSTFGILSPLLADQGRLKAVSIVPIGPGGEEPVAGKVGPLKGKVFVSDPTKAECLWGLAGTARLQLEGETIYLHIGYRELFAFLELARQRYLEAYKSLEVPAPQGGGAPAQADKPPSTQFTKEIHGKVYREVLKQFKEDSELSPFSEGPTAFELFINNEAQPKCLRSQFKLIILIVERDDLALTGPLAKSLQIFREMMRKGPKQIDWSHLENRLLDALATDRGTSEKAELLGQYTIGDDVRYYDHRLEQRLHIDITIYPTPEECKKRWPDFHEIVGAEH